MLWRPRSSSRMSPQVSFPYGKSGTNSANCRRYHRLPGSWSRVYSNPPGSTDTTSHPSSRSESGTRTSDAAPLTVRCLPNGRASFCPWSRRSCKFRSLAACSSSTSVLFWEQMAAVLPMHQLWAWLLGWLQSSAAAAKAGASRFASFTQRRVQKNWNGCRGNDYKHKFKK